MDKKVLLLILDGWGKSPDPSVSAIDLANTPYIDQLYTKYPNAQLRTDGLNVGLPEGQMGNSEVGHMNLGAGRIVYQDLVKINLAVENHTLSKEVELQKALTYAQEQHKAVHIMGLLSDGGVHSHTSHLRSLVEACVEKGLTNIYIHAFTDGRDVDPKSGLKYIHDLQAFLANKPAQLASVVGRYYAMDRDKRWERIKKAYDAIVHGTGAAVTDWDKAMQTSYEQGITDEFIEPHIGVDAHGHPIACLQPDDVVLFFNFRTDRGRQLTTALSQTDFPEFGMKALPLYYVTMTNYDDTYKNVHVIYDKDNLNHTLGQVIAEHGRKQIRIAETEKYPHVTFFFSGGREEPFAGETRLMRNSPKVATYDLQPEMSAFELRDAILPELKNKTADFICMNFANGDMVGHTGVMAAAIKACEAVDTCVEAVVNQALESGYSTILIADHGNCETMVNEDGSPNTAHTINPVPLILIDADHIPVHSGVLGDIAPTILTLMGLPIPAEMTGKVLI